ncbi:MAG TPA: protein kinase [Candidatus Polarisedimenticolia bacterium]|nr:protein kinase [Candidatus Polarisedimenticolia bacterium]
MNESEANPNMEKRCPQCGAPLPSGVLAGLCPACLFKQGAAPDTTISVDPVAFQPPRVEEVARLFPQLEVLAFIGKGGMGAVYKARQPALDRFVALKILPPQTAGGPGFVERFNREARALARLSHPNIVAVHDFGQVNGLPFFIMEYVDGVNLRELEQAGKLSPREALQIVPQICEALQFAHDENIVHRDIKPENILVDKKGRVKIADFGIAKILGRERDAAITETGGAIGTPHYMAPEQMEKPTAVDHRADIFSLGVVFYEMLTGELPLGKFAPPSSRKVEVDVRLDEVVLRALERDPERRYQHASQVKTAVDSIAGSAAQPPPGADAKAMAQEILARDYELNIRSCLRRGWKLLRGDFLRLVGVTALVMALLAFVSAIGGASFEHGPAGHDSTQISGVLAVILWGPLVGGLYLYYLKKIRGETTTIETVFSGFSNRFLHLFLAGFVTGVLTWLGFLCLVLPGIYLLIAWSFTLPLVMDKRLDFWSAMELSRKVVTKHWWKFLGLAIVSLLLLFAGVFVFVIGALVMLPLVISAQMHAYEDVFGKVGQTGAPPVQTGPSGTVVTPGVPPTAPPAAGIWPLAAKIALAAVAVVIAIVFFGEFHAAKKRHRKTARQNEQAMSVPAAASAAPAPVETTPDIPPPVFGPVIERELAARASETNQFLNLDTEQLMTVPPEIANALNATNPGEDDARIWEALDIPQDSDRFRYVDWLRESGADLMFAGDGKIIGFDGIFPVAHGSTSTNWDSWDDLTPDQVRAAVEVVDWTRQSTEAQLRGNAPPPAPKPGGIFSSATQLDSRDQGDPTVNLLTRDQSMTWFFRTREGAMGVLQLAEFTTNNPPTVKIRYKLIQQTNGPDTAAPADTNNISRDALANRLEAASMVNDAPTRNKSLGTVVTDAARAGEVEIVKQALNQFHDFYARNQAALEAVRLLANRGMKKQALEIAKTINDASMRDQALAELAQ